MKCKMIYVKSLTGRRWPRGPELRSGFYNTNREGVLLLPPGGSASLLQSYPHKGTEGQSGVKFLLLTRRDAQQSTFRSEV